MFYPDFATRARRLRTFIDTWLPTVLLVLLVWLMLVAGTGLTISLWKLIAS